MRKNLDRPMPIKVFSIDKIDNGRYLLVKPSKKKGISTDQVLCVSTKGILTKKRVANNLHVKVIRVTKKGIEVENLPRSQRPKEVDKAQRRKKSKSRYFR